MYFSSFWEQNNISKYIQLILGSNGTSFSTVRGKSLDFGAHINMMTKEKMGSLASKKLAEMKSKEVMEKQEMKTEVNFWIRRIPSGSFCKSVTLIFETIFNKSNKII